jgi:hypothetical protein
MWLLGQGTAAADEISVPTILQNTSTAVVDEVVPVAQGLASVGEDTTAVVVVPMVDAVRPVPSPTATPPVPVAEAPVEPVVPVVREVVAPDEGQDTLLGHVVEPVREVSAPIRKVAESAVEPLVTAVAEGPSEMPVVEELDLPAVLEMLTGLPQVGAPSVPQPAGHVGTGGAVQEIVVRAAVPAGPRADVPVQPLAAEGVRSAAVVPAADRAGSTGEDGTVQDLDGSTGVPAPAYLPERPAGTPSRTASSGGTGSDQTHADLPATVPGLAMAARELSRDVDHEVGTLAFDPSFSPD